MNYRILPLLLLFLGCTGRSLAQCSGTWGTPIVTQTFGQGDASQQYFSPLSTYAPGVTTSTAFTTGYINDGYSCLSYNVKYGRPDSWVDKTDHTGDPYGLMLLINAPSTANTVFFEYTIDDLCPNTTMRLSVWMINANVGTLSQASNYQYPDMAISVVDPATNVVLATSSTGSVPADTAWHNYALVFNNGNNTTLKLRLTNFSVGSGYGNDLAIDDITVQPCVPDVVISPSTDTSFCNDVIYPFEALVANSPYNPTEYLWQSSTDLGVTWTDIQPAGTNPQLNYAVNAAVPAGTEYWIRFIAGPVGHAGNSSCSAVSDTAKIRISAKPPPPDIVADTLYCPHDPFAPFRVPPANLKWYETPTGGTGSGTVPTINTAVPGAYTVYASQVDERGCESDLRTPVTFTVHPPPEVDAGTDTVINYGAPYRLAAYAPAATRYLWTPVGNLDYPDVRSPWIMGVWSSEDYVVQVIDTNHCMGVDTVHIRVRFDSPFLIPSAFSPNGDGRNDRFRVVNLGFRKVIEFRVFDRWGQEIYAATDNNGWDGTRKGTTCDMGVYHYLIRLALPDGRLDTYAGDVTLTR